MESSKEGTVGVPSLLEEAANWSDFKVEEEAMSLLECARKVLVNPTSDYETKMKSFSWLADKLLPFVSVFELEDAVYCPMLEAVLVSMEEVMTELVETEEQNREAFLSIADTLLVHSGTLVEHAGRQEGCGLGEVPSLARLLPQLLLSSFRRLEQSEQLATTQKIKGAVKHLFDTSKDLLQQFLKVVSQMKIRPVLEDELDILTTLCQDLVSLHQSLFPLEFKSTLAVWKLYMSLTHTHQAKLSDRLDLSEAPEIICREASDLLDKLARLLGQQGDSSKEASKLIFKASSLVKLLLSLGDNLGAEAVGTSCPALVRLLVALQTELAPLPPWAGDQLGSRLRHELLSDNIRHRVLSLAASSDHFILYLLQFFTLHPVRDILVAKPLSSTLLVVRLLLLLRPAPGQAVRDEGSGSRSLVHLACCLMALSGPWLETSPRMEGRTIPGQAPSLVDSYTWVLTNLCCWVSSATEAQFSLLELALISTLASPKSTVLGCQIASDLWCFIARYGTAELCLEHLLLLTKIYLKLQAGSFSLSSLFVSVLIGRLHSFIGDKEKALWKKRVKGTEDSLSLSCSVTPEEEESTCLISSLTQLTALGPKVCRVSDTLVLSTRLAGQQGDKVDSLKTVLATCVLGTWQRLAQGGYSPDNSLASSRLMLALTEATLVVRELVPVMPLLGHMLILVRASRYCQYMLLCSVKVARMFISQLATTSLDTGVTDLMSDLIKILVSKCRETSLEHLVVTGLKDFLFVYPELEGRDGLVQTLVVEKLGREKLEQLRVEDGVVVWPSQEGVNLARQVNSCEGNTDGFKDCSVPPPLCKKRKLSEDSLEQCLTILGKQVDSLRVLVEKGVELVGEERGNVVSIVGELQAVLEYNSLD